MMKRRGGASTPVEVDARQDENPAELKEDMMMDVEMSEGQKYYENKLEELAAEEESVKNGTHEELKRGVQQLEAVKDRRLRDAELNRELRIKEIEELYNYDKKAAEESYENALSDLKSKIIGEIKESKQRLADLRDGITEAEVRGSSRKLRSKKGEAGYIGDDDMEISNRNDEPKVEPVLGGYGENLGITLFMTENDIGDDLKHIQCDWKERAEKFLSNAEVMEQSVKVADGVLYYNQHIFEKGNDVLCATEVTNEEMEGTIHNINKSEIIVRLLDGTQTRVLLTHLRNGRCTLAPPPAEEE